jgi:hypothetical protein
VLLLSVLSCSMQAVLVASVCAMRQVAFKLASFASAELDTRPGPCRWNSSRSSQNSK